MQNSSIDILFEKLSLLNSNDKNNSLFESHVGPQILDLLFLSLKRFYLPRFIII